MWNSIGSISNGAQQASQTTTVARHCIRRGFVVFQSFETFVDEGGEDVGRGCAQLAETLWWAESYCWRRTKKTRKNWKNKNFVLLILWGITFFIGSFKKEIKIISKKFSCFDHGKFDFQKKSSAKVELHFLYCVVVLRDILRIHIIYPIHQKIK